MRKFALLSALALAACGNSIPGSRDERTNTPPVETPRFAASSFGAPAGEAPSSTSTPIDGQDGAVLPSGRHLTPAGTEVSVLAPKPHALCLSRDGSTALTPNLMGVNAAGIFPLSATLISGADGAAPTAVNIPLDATYNGCVFSADGARVYVAGGDNGNIWVLDGASGQVIGSVNFSGVEHPLPRPLSATDPSLITRSFKGAFPGKMALSPDGHFLYVVDQGAFKLHVVDTRLISTGAPGAPLAEADNFAAVIASIGTGHYPYAVAVSPDGRRVFVANVGVFRYTHLRPENPTGDAGQDYPLCYPATGYPDEVSEPVTVRIEPVDFLNLPLTLRLPNTIRCGYTGPARNYTVPAVGDPNAPESSSVWVYDLSTPASPARIAQVPVGTRIGELEEGRDTYGASHPNAIAASARAVYVSLGNHDAIAVLDPVSFAERARIPLRALHGGDGVLRGLLPSDLALSPDGNTLYVAEAGLNAVGVVQLGAQAGLDGQAQLAGHIPAGWWPSGVQVTPDGDRLLVSNAKGRGAGPSSGAAPVPLLGYPAAVGPKNSTTGTVNIIPRPDGATLAAMTEQVLRNNGLVAGAPLSVEGPVPTEFGRPSSVIKHVILINKENATHDLLLGHITQTRQGEAVEGLPANSIGQSVVPNHTELALQFSFSDNFYLEPVSSSDGHRWLQGFYATEFEETHWPTAYAQKRAASGDDPEIIAGFPGRIAFSGANESPEPIDYNQHGGIFHHLVTHGRTVLNFGMGTELANVDEGADREPTGTSQHVNIPLMKAMRDNSDHLYAGYNTHIPDAPLPNAPERYSRFGRFEQVFNALLVDREKGECKLPSYTTLFLPNDHGGGPTDIEADNPWSFQRFVQDNDAALGLTLELISNSPCWKDTVIFVVEDDTQNGADHVDGQRSILLTLSPWAKREHVSHVHHSLPSVFKTIYLLLGVPPLNQFDAAASDLRGMFTNTPDFTPYVFQPVSYLTAQAPETRAWQLATRNVEFGEMDGDEVNLRGAILATLGLPREAALPLHIESPSHYALAPLASFWRRWSLILQP